MTDEDEIIKDENGDSDDVDVSIEVEEEDILPVDT